MKKIIPIIISILLSAGMLSAAVFLLPETEDPPVNKQKDEIRSEISSNVTQTEKMEAKTSYSDIKGVWVPCMSINMSGTDRSKEAWQEKIDGIMKRIKDTGANTVIFHVRPFSDSIYPSEIYPMSHIISGVQGKNVDYDPLSIAVESAHEKGLQFHAWINPLRISTGKTPDKLAENSKISELESKCGGECIMHWDSGLYLDPSYPEVRKLICDGVREIAMNYDIDGIHIDDYFYPTDDPSIDSSEYKQYKENAGDKALSQNEWRIANINSLISGMFSAAHCKENCVFGIAPQCNIENDYNMAADVRRWCSEEGFCDYICPQTYVSQQHPIMPFNDQVDKWCEMKTADSVRLYFGLGLYKAGTDADNGSWLTRDDNLKTQAEYIKSKNADGFVLYSYDYLDKPETKKEMEELWRQ